MAEPKTSCSNLLRAADIADREQRFSHPWNPLSELHGVRLGHDLGLRRTGVSLARIPPGKESFTYHAHQVEEEWLYILSGRGVAEIDGVDHEIGAGDFMAFPAPSVAHHLRNPHEEDLVYLMGGESREVEVADFPRLGRTIVRVGSSVRVFPTAAGEEFPGTGKGG
jgi:uncharacterized cupin superfamily protein